MADITVTTNDSWDLGGNRTAYLLTLTFDASYPTGGEVINTSTNESFAAVIPFGGTAGYSFSWDKANQKLIAYYNDYDAGADGAHIQVPDTTDLSTPLAAVLALAISD